MDIDRELASYQFYQDTTCENCGGCLIEEYFDCHCEEEDIIDNQINCQR
jgi:hypothetical protein